MAPIRCKTATIFLAVIAWSSTPVQPETLAGCAMQIIIDRSLHSHLVNRYATSQSADIDKTSTRQKIYLFVQEHIDFANSILEKYTLLTDNRGVKKSIRLYSKNIKVIPEDCQEDHDENKHLCQFPATTNSSIDFLSKHSESNHNDYCLSFIFTNNQFHDGSLGLAYQAHPLRVDEGGVCSRFAANTNSPTGGQSRNTGFVSFSNQGRSLPLQVTKLIFVHEIGHSLGSPHDYPTSCMRSRTSNGHYIMHPKRGVQGFLDSNYQFSSCSIKNMSISLASLSRFGRACLTPPPASVCGNGVIEGWEECDCGENYDDCAHDNCCYPANHPTAPCTLKPRAQCSPSEGPCCTSDCKIVSILEEQTCHPDGECNYKAVCDGKTSKCPSPDPKQDSLPCESGSKLCQVGQCSVSACAQFNMVECSPMEGEAPCEVHCQARGRPETCRSSSSLKSLFREPTYHATDSLCHIVSRSGKEGEPALVDFGYCDPNHICSTVTSTNRSPYRAYETPSVWVVGLVMALVAYLAVNALVVYTYCRYFKYRQPAYQQQSIDIADNSESQIRAIDTDEINTDIRGPS